MSNAYEPRPCKIEIDIKTDQNWTLKIDGTEQTFAQRFSIDLQRGIRPVTYTIEDVACLRHAVGKWP